MQASGSESSLEQAPQVCRACKIRKRKCNKALPKCSSCAKRNVVCDYTSPERTGYSEQAFASNPWAPPAQSIDFPTMLFLDPGLLQQGQVEIAQAVTPIPTHILHMLGDIEDIRATACKFFEHIHTWMPFISKKRFHELSLRPSFHSRPDVCMLLLYLKLITVLPPP
ncbi:hypothetical protein BO70DRAFT_430067, partial [Aspergillus heteromorphus CBS 117.55]